MEFLSAKGEEQGKTQAESASVPAHMQSMFNGNFMKTSDPPPKLKKKRKFHWPFLLMALQKNHQSSLSSPD